MQAGKNIKAANIFDEQTSKHPYRCVGGNGLRGYTEFYNTDGHFAIVGRQGALCGCLNIENGRFYATEHAVVVDTYDILSPWFMYYFLMALNLNQYATATAQPGLAVSNIMEVLCPVPPLFEQDRIIKRIEILLPLIETFNKLQTELQLQDISIKNKLKKSILQDAIQGKLVPQMAEEGTADDLLETIKEEKQRLVKEGKLKKSALNDSVIFKDDDNKYCEKIGKTVQCIEDENLFEIPESWEWVRLENCIELLSGRDLEPNQYNDKKLGIPYITGASNFKNGSLCVNRWTNSPITIAKKGDLLLTCKGTIGAMAYNNIGDIHIARQVMGIKTYNVDLDYIRLYLQFNINTLEKNANSMIPGISRNTILKMILPLPPLAEQQRIVEKVNQLTQLLK